MGKIRGEIGGEVHGTVGNHINLEGDESG